MTACDIDFLQGLAEIGGLALVGLVGYSVITFWEFIDDCRRTKKNLTSAQDDITLLRLEFKGLGAGTAHNKERISQLDSWLYTTARSVERAETRLKELEVVKKVKKS